MTKFTDSQILEMLKAPWQWADQLRQEAKCRRLSVTSVTSLVDVANALRTSLRAESRP